MDSPAHPIPSAPSKSARGFSLIEMMVVVSLLAILAGLAAPSFTGMIESYQVASARDNLLSTLQFARTEAIRTGQPITVRRRGGCPSNNWGCGWIVFQDTNGDNLRQAAEPLIRATELQRGVSIRANNVAANNFVRVNSFGQFAGSMFFAYQMAPINTPDSRHCIALTFSSGMRATSTKGSDNCP